ncbi:sensor histidine kinase [Gilvibacter sp.]|uniref:sensor histidine kinase n=1 Tax=Gilvibacter sp. TaxID=2729997 RepID=UPI0035BE1D5E
MGNSSSNYYLNEYEKAIYNNREHFFYKYYSLFLTFQFRNTDTWDKDLEEEMLLFAAGSTSYYLNANIYYLIASYYDRSGNTEKGIELLNLAGENLKQIRYGYANTLKRSVNITKAGYYYSLQKIDSTSFYLEQFDKPPKNRLEQEHKMFEFFYKSMVDSIKGDYFNAYHNLYGYTDLLELSYLNKSEKNYKEIEAKYQNEKQQKDLLLEEQKSSRNKNIAFGLGGTLFLGSIIAFLVYRNTKRKQRIAEQEKEIEVQKTEKILKEQELNTIDAMIAGQEKERQRLASDLHDSVGATLSAAKMQFEHLKKHRGSLNNEDELYDRTQLLLEEAYTEVRAMAHAKNSGVIAKNGLLPAVNKLAQNASATGKIQIEVQDYGLDQRLEGSLEIAVFRIIQELVTNIIKHAEATEASISLTQHEDAINVVVEDNGKGFKAGKLSNNSGGMGLGSIEKRVEHMEGQMEVDSTPGKGTSVIIDIPL